MKIVTSFTLFILAITVNPLATASSDTKLAENNIAVSAFQSCVNISHDINRLACFDKLSSTLKLKNEAETFSSVKSLVQVSSEISSKSTVPAAIETTPVSSSHKESDFAKEHLKKTKTEKAQEVTSITTTVKKLKKLVRGQWIIYLENGQKWQQKDTTKMKLKVGDTIRLKKGAMSAVYLYKAGSHKNIRVKRLL